MQMATSKKLRLRLTEMESNAAASTALVRTVDAESFDVTETSTSGLLDRLDSLSAVLSSESGALCELLETFDDADD